MTDDSFRVIPFGIHTGTALHTQPRETMDAPRSSQESLSNYVKHLDTTPKSRYVEKCRMIGVSDPYTLPPSMFKDVYKCPAQELPDLAYHDLYNYLVNKRSYFTGKGLKSYKSLEAYRYFVAGWVSNVQKWKVPHKNLDLIMSRVSVHSFCTCLTKQKATNWWALGLA